MTAHRAWRAAIVAAWGVAVLAVARLVSVLTLAADDAISPRPAVQSATARKQRESGARPASLVDSIVAHDPFGIFVEPIDVISTAPSMPLARIPMPSMTPRVRAVVGPPWRVLLSPPGATTPPREVAVGDSVFGYTVVRITAGAVRLRGRDTLITVTLGGSQ